MRQHWFTSALGAITIAAGTSWTQTGTVYAVSFTSPPDNAAPRSATGGASRGNFFTPPPDNTSPRNSTGGASRGSFFTPPPNNTSPRNSTGGASRGNFFTPPPDNAAPRNSTGGASRGQSLTPLANEDASQSAVLQNGLSRSNAYGGAMYSATGQKIPAMVAVMPSSFYGTTLKARPTILVYVPSSDASEAIFSIKDEAKNMVYQKVVTVPETGGIVAIEMPAEAPELAVGNNYQWYVAMKLQGELSPASPFVDGWVQRVAPNAELAAALSEGDDLQDVENLGANGIWYDTVAQLASLKAAQQNVEIDEANGAIAAHWNELLESVGLAEIAAAPIVL